MKKFLLAASILFAWSVLPAQKVDSIFFHLYTDSLKKGTHNYINVDGKMSNGSWQPMTSKQVRFSSSSCEFSGNDLIVPADFKGDKITVTAELINDPSQRIETTIWIKRKPDPILQTKDDIMREGNRGRRRR